MGLRRPNPHRDWTRERFRPQVKNPSPCGALPRLVPKAGGDPIRQGAATALVKRGVERDRPELRELAIMRGDELPHLLPSLLGTLAVLDHCYSQCTDYVISDVARQG